MKALEWFSKALHNIQQQELRPDDRVTFKSDGASGTVRRMFGNNFYEIMLPNGVILSEPVHADMLEKVPLPSEIRRGGAAFADVPAPDQRESAGREEEQRVESRNAMDDEDPRLSKRREQWKKIYESMNGIDAYGFSNAEQHTIPNAHDSAATREGSQLDSIAEFSDEERARVVGNLDDKLSALEDAAAVDQPSHEYVHKSMEMDDMRGKIAREEWLLYDSADRYKPHSDSDTDSTRSSYTRGSGSDSDTPRAHGSDSDEPLGWT